MNEFLIGLQFSLPLFGVAHTLNLLNKKGKCSSYGGIIYLNDEPAIFYTQKQSSNYRQYKKTRMHEFQ